MGYMPMFHVKQMRCAKNSVSRETLFTSGGLIDGAVILTDGILRDFFGRQGVKQKRKGQHQKQNGDRQGDTQ